MGTLDPTDGNIALLGTSTSIDMNAISTTTGATAVAVNARRMYFHRQRGVVPTTFTPSIWMTARWSIGSPLSASVATPPVSTLTTSQHHGRLVTTNPTRCCTPYSSRRAATAKW